MSDRASFALCILFVLCCAWGVLLWFAPDRLRERYLWLGMINDALILLAYVTMTIVLLTILGCAVQPSTWSKETRYEEVAYQSLNVVDTLQTMRVARHPNEWSESESAWMIGKHPSQGTVLAFGAAKAAVHACITAELAQDGAPQLIQRIWEVITIGEVGRAVAGNYSIGLKWGF